MMELIQEQRTEELAAVLNEIDKRDEINPVLFIHSVTPDSTGVEPTSWRISNGDGTSTYFESREEAKVASRKVHLSTKLPVFVICE